MWTFDDAVRDAISASYALLREDKYEEFLASVPETLAKLRDLNSKELEVLLPTSYKLLSDEEFVRMSKNDHEIGYAIIPVSYTHLDVYKRQDVYRVKTKIYIDDNGLPHVIPLKAIIN